MNIRNLFCTPLNLVDEYEINNTKYINHDPVKKKKGEVPIYTKCLISRGEKYLLCLASDTRAFVL